MSRKLSYSLQLIVNWLDDNNISYKFSSPQTGVLCETGVIIKLFGDFTLSIQTHPLITVDSFAETSLLFNGVMCYTHDWDYYDMRRYHTPLSLFSHIEDMNERLTNYTEIRETNNIVGILLRDGIEVRFINDIMTH